MDGPRKAIEDLSPGEREALEAAHSRLRDAVSDYDRFLGLELQPGTDAPAHSLEKMSEAQARVQDAEAELWSLREKLLGWRRPSWAQSAVLVSDWFSVEDSDYDDYPISSSA